MTKEAIPTVDYQHARIDYEARYPMEMALLRAGGVYPGEYQEMINPYNERLDTEYFGNVGQHCLAVAMWPRLLRRDFLSDYRLQLEKAERQGLVHDSGKRFERMRGKAGVDAYSPQAYETIKEILTKEGIASDLIKYMAQAGKETGHNSLVDFVRGEGDQAELAIPSFADAIVHLADDMSHTPIVPKGQTAPTYYLTVRERMEASDFPHRYSFLYTDGFGFDHEGHAVLVKYYDRHSETVDFNKNRDVSYALWDGYVRERVGQKYTPGDWIKWVPLQLRQEHPALRNVHTYAYWQAWVAEEISRYLVDIMSPATPMANAQQYLKEVLYKELEVFNQTTY